MITITVMAAVMESQTKQRRVLLVVQIQLIMLDIVVIGKMMTHRSSMASKSDSQI
jgi:hypothetical protein